MQATFKGGYTLAFWKADVTTGDAAEIWHNQRGDSVIPNVFNPRLAGDYVVFPAPAGAGGRGGPAPLPQLRRGQARPAGRRWAS